jgi:hypothetical protein
MFPEMSYEDACAAVVRAAATASPSAVIQYAASYAEAGRGVRGHEAAALRRTAEAAR